MKTVRNILRAWVLYEAICFVAWAACKTYRLLFPKHGVLTPNTMKLWSQFAYVDNPAAAEAFWQEVPWTWEKRDEEQTK
jgi:hypothetical protein